MILLVILLNAFVAVNGFIGYDCALPSVNITTLSLLGVAPCDVPQPTLSEAEVFIQLLQINKFTDAQVIQCKVITHRVIHECRWFSYISDVHNGVADLVNDVTAQGCKEMFMTNMLKMPNGQVINNIPINITKSYPVTLAGTIEVGGKCSGAGYADTYGSWTNVVVQGTVQITLSHHRARIDLNNDRIHLKSGTICKLSDLYCIDAVDGYSFWNPIPTDQCGFKNYGILYEGMATRAYDTASENKNTTIYSLNSQDVTFALTVKDEQRICGYKVFRTEHPKLVIFETRQGISFADRSRISADNLDIFTYVNSKFVYVERHIRTQMKNLYVEVVTQRCELERETIKNSLAIAVSTPDQFAYNLMKGPGYMGVISGEVVHVIKCIPIEVSIRHTTACYSELPVRNNNEDRFLTPKTHILKNKGTRIECDRILPIFFRLREGWHRLSPVPIKAVDPEEIRPMSIGKWNYEEPQHLAESGIYTPLDLEKLRDRIMFPVEKNSVLNDFTREIQGHPIDDKQGTLSRLWNEDFAEKIVESTWGKIYNKLVAFGTVSAAFIAIFVIIQFVKFLVQIIANGVALHRVYGFSAHLLGAIWTSLTHLLVQLASPPTEAPAPSPRECIPEHELVELNPKQEEKKPVKKEERRIPIYDVPPRRTTPKTRTTV